MSKKIIEKKGVPNTTNDNTGEFDTLESGPIADGKLATTHVAGIQQDGSGKGYADREEPKPDLGKRELTKFAELYNHFTELRGYPPEDSAQISAMLCNQNFDKDYEAETYISEINNQTYGDALEHSELPPEEFMGGETILPDEGTTGQEETE